MQDVMVWDRWCGWLRRSKLGPLSCAVLIQLAVLLLATSVVVLVPQFKSKAVFVAKKKIYLPQQELEHKVALAEFQNAAQSSLQIDPISSSALLPDALPALPSLPLDAFSLSGESPLSSQALLGDSGLLGALQTLQAGASSASLFGIEDSGQRILILFDNSATVWNKASAAGVSTQDFVTELSQLIDSLGPNTMFGLVPFAQQVGTYQDQMVAAGARNRAAAKQWVAKHVRSPRKSTQLPFKVNGVQGALTVAFQMAPEVIFIISDGDFQRGKSVGVAAGDVPWSDLEQTLRALQREFGLRPRIHFVGFRVEPQAAEAIQRITRRHRGSFRDFARP